MIKPDLLLIGAGAHSRSCADVIEQQGHFRIAGLIDSHNRGSKDAAYSVIGNDNDLINLAKKYRYALICIGQIKSAELRIQIYQRLIQMGFQLPTIIAPTAYVSPHAILGAGTIIMHGAIVNAGARVGNNCIINSRSLIEHDVLVRDHCHISTGAILNGGVIVGMGSFIGSSSVIKQGVVIGDGCLVGLGLAVRADLADYVCFAGK
jgi:sugar O-acyltransferase (sialic acid O-acetyltransferase NeuD family)